MNVSIGKDFDQVLARPQHLVDSEAVDKRELLVWILNGLGYMHGVHACIDSILPTIIVRRLGAHE